jgi:hypothetical protein
MAWDAFLGRSREPEPGHALEDADRLSEAATRLVDEAAGSSWYTDPANGVDRALVALCRLRRAASGHRRSSEGGDEAVRAVLENAKPESLVWLSSRVVSYLDEAGFPEDVEPWLARD